MRFLLKDSFGRIVPAVSEETDEGGDKQLIQDIDRI